jgi:hypothetical protein
MHCGEAAREELKSVMKVAEGATAADRLQAHAVLSKHRRGIRQHLEKVQQGMVEWENAVCNWQARAVQQGDWVPTSATTAPQQLQPQSEQQLLQQELQELQQVQRQRQEQVLQPQQQRLQETQLSLERTQSKMIQFKYMVEQEQKQWQDPLRELQLEVEEQQQHQKDLQRQHQKDVQLHLQLQCQQASVDQELAVLEIRLLLCGTAFCHRQCRLRLAGCGWGACTQQEEPYTADAGVAGRKGVRCGGCGLVRYCCPQHQEKDWPGHRQVCRLLAQARAAAAGGISHSGSSHHAA